MRPSVNIVELRAPGLFGFGVSGNHRRQGRGDGEHDTCSGTTAW
jgi:hypothetical protein